MAARISGALAAAAVLLTASVSVTAQRGGGPPGAAAPNPAIGNPEAIAAGEKLYNETCTACHGKDGNGGELGPPIAAQNRRYLRRTDPEVFDAVRNGIAGTQMPPFTTQMSDDDIWKVTAYIHGLRGTAFDTPAQGNVGNGEAIFWGKGECGGCHMIKARGSILGPDLSNIAGIRKIASIVDALTKAQHGIPGDGGTHDSTLLPLGTYQPVRVTLADGKVISGVLKNEDSFSLQLLSREDSQLHLLKRAAVKEIFYDPKSLMPTDYDKRLSPAEFQDLMAFLTRQYVPPPTPAGRGGGVG